MTPAWRVATFARPAAGGSDVDVSRSARSSNGSLGSMRTQRSRFVFASPARAPCLGDAVGADDGHERQPRDGTAVQEVPKARGLSCGAAGGARARHLHDRLLPAEGEVDPRHHAVLSRSSTARFRGRSRSSCGCPASPARRRTSSQPSSVTRRERRRHPRPAPLAAPRAHPPGDPVKIERDLQKVVPRADGRVSRTSSSGTAAGSATRGDRSASSA